MLGILYFGIQYAHLLVKRKDWEKGISRVFPATYRRSPSLTSEKNSQITTALKGLILLYDYLELHSFFSSLPLYKISRNSGMVS